MSQVDFNFQRLYQTPCCSCHHIEQLNIFKSHFLSFDVKTKLQKFNGQLPSYFRAENSKLKYINAIDLTLNGFCQNRGQGFSMGGKPKPCKLVSSMYLAHIVTQTMCYLYTLFKKEMGLFKIF